MSTHAILERRYRRLLAWYPAAHRREHEDEMLGVLLAASRPGQSRPGAADAVSLLWGGLQVRARASLRDHSDPRWHGALAAASVTLPLAWLGMWAASILLQLPGLLRLPGVHLPPGEFVINAALRGMVPVVFTVLLLLGLRRTTAVLALLAAACFGILSWRLGPASPGSVFPAFFCLAEAAALLASGGPRRGWQILTWRRRWLVMLAAAALVTATMLQYRGLMTVLILAVAVSALVAALLFPTARRVLALLVIPAYPLLVSALDVQTGRPWLPGMITLLYLPPLAMAALIVTSARRSAVTRPASR